MSDEVILNLSFDNQTVTDLTGNWILDGTPNATYEQIDGRAGYSIVEGSLGRCIVLNAVDQNARYDEYTVDFDMFVKSTYTSYYYDYNVFYLWSEKNPNIVGSFDGKIGEVLSISPTIGISSPVGVTHYSPIGRWVHVTITSGPTSEEYLYHTAVYVDGVKLTERTDSGAAHDGNPFGISQRIIPCARDPNYFLMPNGPGVCLNTYKIVAGIHAPDQEPAISLLNLRRVFNNFCAWLKGQLSTVALTGSYNDLSDKPTISTVNDGTLTIQKNGVNVQTFTANQSTAATANITVPTAVSELTNDSGYLTSSSNLDASKLTSGTVDIARLPQGALERLIKVANEAARYALTTADVQLGDTVQQLDTGIMYIVTDADHLDSAAGYTEYTAGTAASVPWSGVTGKPTFAAVATSGAYSDLTGTPTIPTVNNATLTIQKNGTNVQTFTANQSTNATANITVPTKTSDLTNDSGFITSDNTKIPLAGSNAISGSLIPATTDSINLGGPSYQWNQAYIKSLTINGVAAGDILTHNASEFVPRSGGNVLTGEAYRRNVDGSLLALYGGTEWDNSAFISLSSTTRSGALAGTFLLQATASSSSYKRLIGYPDGKLVWANNLVISENSIGCTDNSRHNAFLGGNEAMAGGRVLVYGYSHSLYGGWVRLSPTLSSSSFKEMNIRPDGTWTWDGTACQIISDQRLKQQIAEIDDKLLDAWEDVDLVQFKYNDAVDQKGKDNARLHTGYVVQQINSACKSHNVDISQYGLYCHEEYPQETEEVEVEQKDGTKVKETKVIREASEHYSLRYTEVYAVECMYLRRCIKQLTARIEQLEKGKEQEASK